MNLPKPFNIRNQVSAYDEAYMKDWTQVNSIMYENGMTWGASLEETQESHYQKEAWCQYVVLSLLEMPQSEIEHAQNVSKDLFDAMQEAVLLFNSYTPKVKKQLLTEMGFSEYNQYLILNAEHLDLFSYLCRFDLVYDTKTEDYKCLEVNSATPMGFTESAIANSVVNDYHHTTSPNKLEKGLVDMWDNIRQELNIPPDETIYFSSLRDHDEDRMNVEFQMNHAGRTGNVAFIALEDIYVDDNGLFDENQEPIKYWYKLFPVEFWEKEPKEFSHKLAKIVSEHLVTMINPIDAFLAQNKGFYAWLWSLVDDKEALISERTKATFKRHLLPTYYHKPESMKDYVIKPIFGREGNCVDIYKDGSIYFKDDEHEATEYYDTQKKIYQQYIEMPDLTVESWDGAYTGKWLIGAYTLGGVPSGLYHRVGHLVTGSQSLFLPYTQSNEVNEA